MVYRDTYCCAHYIAAAGHPHMMHRIHSIFVPYAVCKILDSNLHMASITPTQKSKSEPAHAGPARLLPEGWSQHSLAQHSHWQMSASCIQYLVTAVPHASCRKFNASSPKVISCPSPITVPLPTLAPGANISLCLSRVS